MDNENEMLPALPAGVGMDADLERDLQKDDGLRFLTLMHGVSKAVIRNTPKGIRAGDFLLGTERIPAGNEGDGFRCCPILTRPRAVYFKDDAVSLDSFDPKSKDWQQIAALAAAWTQGAKVGFEHLLWLPDHDAMAVLMTANKERSTSGAKLIECRNKKQMAQVTTTIRGKKDSVVLVVTALEKPDACALPTPERLAKCVAAFESYKLEESAQEAPNSRER